MSLAERYITTEHIRHSIEISRGLNDSGLRKAMTLSSTESIFPATLDSFTELFSNEELRRDAEIDLEFRYKDVWNIVKQKNHTDEQLCRNREKMIQILILTNFGTRLGNETLILSTHSKNENDFGQRFREARKNPKNFDHGELHERGVDAAQLLNLILLGPEYLDIQTGVAAVVAPMESIFHDSMQLWMEDRKDREYEDGEAQRALKKINPKDYHIEAGAAFVHILRPYIQRAGHLSDDLTTRLVGTLSENISVHDVPEKLRAIFLDGEKKTAEMYQTPDELYAAYESGELVRRSLSGKEWLLILSKKITSVYEGEELKKSGSDTLTVDQKHSVQTFISQVYGAYGFGGEIEQFFSGELERMQCEAVRIQWGSDQSEQQHAYLWNLLFNIADTNEMIRPGFAAVIRKLRVHWSRTRRLMVSISDSFFNNDAAEALNDSPQIRGYNQSDWCRQAHEWIIMAKLFADSPFFQDTLFSEYIKNTYLRNMIQAEALYEILAKGEEGIEELHVQKKERILAIAEKAIRKSGIEETQRDAAMNLLKTNGYDIWQIRSFVKSYLSGKKYKDRFLKQFTRIDVQIDTVVDNLRQKPGPSMKKGPDGVYAYSEIEILCLQRNFIQIWEQVCDIFQIPKDKKMALYAELSEDRSVIKINEHHGMIPNSSIDSLGALSDARTVNLLDDSIRMQLLDMDP